MTIAFIPLRGGSKSIPGKNIKLIAGRPLACWVIEAAAECPDIGRVVVSTDDEEIRMVANDLGHPKVEVVGRSEESARDTATTESAMLEFAESHTFDRIILIQATSPLLTSADLTAGLAELDRTKADSLLSGVRQTRFLWARHPDGAATPRNYDPMARPRRQDFDPYFVENGAFYICRRGDLLRSRCRLSGRVALHVMADETFYELDEESDWTIIEGLLLRRMRANSTTPTLLLSGLLTREEFTARAQRIKLFLTDVDGVLTDSGMYYAETGDEYKKFNTRDGKGFELLRDAGIQTGILTSENTRIVERRAAKLKIDHLIQGARDKLSPFVALLERIGIVPEEVAYIGDDIADLPLLNRVGLGACPADGIPEARRIAHYTCRVGGGGGAVREFAEAILGLRSIREMAR